MHCAKNSPTFSIREILHFSSITMAGFLLSSDARKFLLVVSCLFAMSSSAPVDECSPDVTVRDNVRKLHLDDIGVYLHQIFKETYYFPHTSLTLEVRTNRIFVTELKMHFFQLNGTVFDSHVCPLFGIYSHLEQTLQTLSENDTITHNVSVLTFVTKRQTEALCERVSIIC